MTDNVVDFTGETRLDMPAERVLKAALEADLEGVVVLGYTKDGIEYMASSMASGPEANWLLDRAKHALMEGMGEDD